MTQTHHSYVHAQYINHTLHIARAGVCDVIRSTCTWVNVLQPYRNTHTHCLECTIKDYHQQTCICPHLYAYFPRENSRLPEHNWGVYPGLTLSMWFKPSASAGSSACLLDFGNGANMNNIVAGRSESSTRMVFYIVTSPASQVSALSRLGVWMVDEWHHFSWILSRVNSTYTDWLIHIDGVLDTRLSGVFPINDLLQRNFIGRSNYAPSESMTYYGLIDSVYIHGVALSSAEVELLFTVRACVYLCMFALTWTKTCVSIHSWICKRNPNVACKNSMAVTVTMTTYSH